MRAVLTRIPFLVCLSVFAASAGAQTVTVGTGASETATYGTTSQSFGPFPWTDLGITASASVTPGTMNVQTGGSTSYTLDSTVTSGESFVAGTTTLNLGYTPGWTGSFASTPPAATGGLNSQFVYHVGPFNGSDTLLNVPLAVPGANGASLSSSLNAAVVSPPVVSQQTASGPGVSAGVGIQAQACFIGCVTVASASVSFNIGSQIQQTVLATPIATYGNLVWESTSQTFSPTAVFVAGSLGNVADTFHAPPSSLGLTSGQTFYYNFLPAVQLTMPVTNDAQVALPASITASYDIFGDSGSQTWPLGNLYTLDTGGESFDFNPTFYASNFYSIPLEYQAAYCPPAGIACFGATYTVEGGGGNPVTTTGGGVPSDGGPCGGSLIDCMVSVPVGPGSPGGYGDTPTNPLFPGDPSTGDICGPVGTPYAGQCINQITQTGGVPEPGTLSLALLALAGTLALSRRSPLSARRPS